MLNKIQQEKLKKRNKEIIRLHNKLGLTLREIAKRYRISYERVRQIITENNKKT